MCHRNRIGYRTFRKEIGIWSLLAVSFISRAIIYTPHSPIWDSSVYILMGKYIYSLGQSGLWQALAPVFWPLILGFFWRLGFDPIFWGKLFELLLSLGSIWLTYLIGKLVFDKSTGILGALFLGFSRTYFYWGNFLLTGIPSTFFSLLAVYYLLRNRNILSGFLFGISFLTRFIQGVVFLCSLLAMLAKKIEKIDISKIVKITFGFLILAIPFLIFNYFMYREPIFPLSLAIKTVRAYEFVWFQGSDYYLKQLVRENFLFLFFPIGIFFIIRNRDHNKTMILTICIVLFALLHAVKAQAARYLIPILPYLFLVCGYGLSGMYTSARRYRLATNITLLLISFFFILQLFVQLDISFPEKRMSVFQAYIEKNQGRVKGPIWISNPTMLVYTNLKAAQLMYYPVFDTSKSRKLRGELDNAELIMFDTGDFPCLPKGDGECVEEKKKLL